MRVADDDPNASRSSDLDPACRVDAWALTRRLSPRLTVRVTATDATGAALNSYTGQQRLEHDAPERPWAVYLADRGQRYKLLAFDLDAKGDPAAAQRDAHVLTGLLDDAGIAHVLCCSGPSDGRHVWVGLVDGVVAATVATLARLVRHLLPTLDLSPLTNPATGCVRPPGAPHRHGGTSTVLRGDVATLTAPSTTPAQVQALVTRLAQLVEDFEPAHDPTARTPLPVDPHGHLYLPGPRRPLPPVSAAALASDVTAVTAGGAVTGDASAVLWTVLIGAASARWHHDDVAALVPTAPGLEHVRTLRDRSTRRPRPAHGPTSAAKVLRRQWHKAVRHVATTARQIGADPTFDARADAITATVRAVQARADAAAGRWATRTGPTDRRVLDVLCTLVLQALSAQLEADVRRLALLAGIGRETARTGLLRLAAEGWIAQTAAATGPHGAHWTITPPGAIHSSTTHDRSQADPRPAGAGAAERLALLTVLTARTADAAHDVFTPRPVGLGHQAGNTWARLVQPTATLDLARTTAHSPDQVVAVLHQLEAQGLVARAGDTWVRPGQDRRDEVAAARGVAGQLQERAHRYAIERTAWAWWQAEQTWMRAPRRGDARRRAATGQLDLLAEPGTITLGAHPRRADGRADFRAARAIVTTTPGARLSTTTPSPDAPRRPQQSRAA